MGLVLFCSRCRAAPCQLYALHGLGVCKSCAVVINEERDQLGFVPIVWKTKP